MCVRVNMKKRDGECMNDWVIGTNKNVKHWDFCHCVCIQKWRFALVEHLNDGTGYQTKYIHSLEV